MSQSERGRPPFIPKDVFRQYLRGTTINKYLKIDGILTSSYIVRCERDGRPLPHKISEGIKKYRPIDIVARARAQCLIIAAPDSSEKLSASISELKAEIALLEQQRASMIDEKAIAPVVRSLTGKALLTEQEIVASSAPWDKVCGVYFLILKGSVIYVGQSIDVFSRISSHVGHKKFDSFSYVMCDKTMLDKIESLYIHFLRPKMNGNMRNGFKLAPLSLNDLLSTSQTEAIA